jgi:Recombinase/Resolvase, N terminal domain/Recombinase zinc beta ribbon domain
MKRSVESLKGKRGACLVRVSSEKQDTDRQINTLKSFLTKHGLTVTDWYEDVRSRMDAHKAVNFQKLMQKVEKDQYDFILILSQNRFGMLHDFEFSSFCHRLLDHGVELWDTVSGHLNDPQDLSTRVLTVVNNAASDKELTEKAYHTITGKVEAIKKGTTYFGGNIPFGAAVAVYNPSDELKFTVEVLGFRHYQKVYPGGSTEEKIGSFPAYEENDQPRYVWSQVPARVEMVQNLFHWFAYESWTFNGLAKKLMQLGVRSYSDVWQSVQVKNLLSNPIYIGIPTWNKSGGSAKKWELIGGEYQPVPLHRNRPVPTKKKTQDDWLPVPEKYRPSALISPETWETVQEKIMQTVSKPAPRKEKLWLSGLVVCGKCGKVMTGINKNGRKAAHYACTTHRKFMGKDNPAGCWPNRAPLEILEKLVTQYLDDCSVGLDVLTRANDDPELIVPILERLAAAQNEYQEAFWRLYAFNLQHLPEGESEFLYTPQHKDGIPFGFGFDVKVRKTEDGQEYHIVDECQANDVDLYRHLYGSQKNKLLAEKADLCRQREDVYERTKMYKSEYARQRADDELDALSVRIAEYDTQLERLDTAVGDTANAMWEAHAAVNAARKALQGDSIRTKIETVRKVVGQVVCHFTEHPQAKSRVPSTQLVKVEIFPCDPRFKPKSCDTFDSARARYRSREACKSGDRARPYRIPRKTCHPTRP